MLNRIIEFSLRHRGIVLLLSLAVVGLGLLSLQRLSIDAYPDATDVLVDVNTVAPALTPEEIEKQITTRVEQAMGGLPSLKLMRSISKFGLSKVTLIFEDGTDLYFARAQVLERLQRIELPEEIERPTMGPIATGLGEIYHYLFSVGGKDPTQARVLHDWVVKPQLLSVPGVAEVNSWGGFEKQFEVVIDPVRLQKHRLNLSEVAEAVRASNFNVGGGNIVAAGELLLVSGRGLLTTTAEIGGVTITARDGRPVRVRDVADVVEAHAIRRGVVTAEGQGETVLGLGFMLMGENSHEVARRLQARMEQIKPSLPEGTKVRVVYDRTHLVDLVIHTVRKNLFEGALLVIAVLFAFLGHFRAACIVAAAIPLSMLFAFSCMVQAGVACTLMSMGALDFGLVVDSSVILVENCVRRLQIDDPSRPVIDVVADAAKEVRKPTMYGELIIMIVYLPILALQGVEGKLFTPMALTVVFALLGSMLFSLTLMPVLASLFLSRRNATHAEPLIVRACKWLYAPLVRFAVSHRILMLGAAVITIVGTIPIALNLGAVFVPRLDEGSIVINTTRLPGVSVEESARFGSRIEATLKQRFPNEIRAIWTRTGTPEVATDPMGIEVSDVFIMLTDRRHWSTAHTREELQEQMEHVLRRLPGMNFAFTQPIEMRFNEMISGVRADLGVKIFGDDFEQLSALSERVRTILNGIPGASSPRVEPLVGQPVMQVQIDHEALSRYGLQARDVLELVAAIGGNSVGEVRIGQTRFPLVVRVPERYRENPDLVADLPVLTNAGQRLKLGQLARVERTSGPMVITREWQRRRGVVSCNVSGRDLGSFVADARRRIHAELGPDLARLGYWIDFGGQFENLERGAKRLALIVPVALVLILFLLYSTYGNVWDCLRVFASVPFAIVGGVWALHLRDLPFSISAGVGFIALSGVAVLGDMVMVSTIRDLTGAGMPVRRAAVEAAVRRLRPVLMTTLVASLGFLPMALNTGVGAEVQRPLATVVIGGLITATIETLLLLPTLYVLMKGRRGEPDGATDAGVAVAEVGA